MTKEWPPWSELTVPERFLLRHADMVFAAPLRLHLQTLALHAVRTSGTPYDGKLVLREAS